MTDKEFHRLSRRELLQLLLMQGREAEKIERKCAETEKKLHDLEKSYEHIKRRLDDKDRKIFELKNQQWSERMNRRIQLAKAGSIAEAALQFNKVFETAQAAADQYIYNVKLMYGAQEEPQEDTVTRAESMGITLSEQPTIQPTVSEYTDAEESNRDD